MRFCILVLLTAAFGFSAHGRQDPNGCIADLVNEFNEDFVLESLTRVEAFWSAEFKKRGWPFHEIGYAIVNGSMETPCGLVKGEQGMVYCPASHTVYVDIEYYRDQLQLPGPYLAYAFGYQFSHHVQNMLGVTEKVLDFYEHSVGVEKLKDQAECLTGIYVRHLLASGQLEQRQVDALIEFLDFRKFYFIKGFHSRDTRFCDNFYSVAPLRSYPDATGPSSSATSRLLR